MAALTKSCSYTMPKAVAIMQEVCEAVATVLDIDINYQYGPESIIASKLKSQTERYPMIAVIQAIDEDSQEYPSFRFPRVVIAALTNSEKQSTERYADVFEPVLYPIYTEFIKQLVRHKNVLQRDMIRLDFTKRDVLATQAITEGLNDYVDTIEIINLRLQILKSVS